MKIFKIICIIFLLMLLFVVVFDKTAEAQHFPMQYRVRIAPLQYGQVLSYGAWDISSDFGRRNPPNTIWHKGIDISRPFIGDNQKGDQILNPVNGSVHMIKGDDYKIIVIKNNNSINFAYGHIFNKGTINEEICGDFVLKRMEEPYNNDYAIIDLTNNRAYGRRAPSSETKVIYNNIVYAPTSSTYIYTNIINQDQPIAPVGDSGPLNSNWSTHIHLYLIDNINLITSSSNIENILNNKNPLQYLFYPQTGYDILIQGLDTESKYFNNLTEFGGNTNYPGNIKASVVVKPQLVDVENTSRYTTTVMDVDQVSLYIVKSFEPLSAIRTIKGNFFESKMIYGGRQGVMIYPYPNNPTNSPVNLSSTTGSFTISGIHPYAYSDDNPRPFDLHYFSDIYTRIHKNHILGQTLNFAPVVKVARYPDGKYNLIAEVTTIKNLVHRSTDNQIKSIIIDNFRPYLEKIEVFNVGLNYSAKWEVNSAETVLTLKTEGSKQPLDRCNSTRIILTFTEPMQACTLKVGTNTITAFNQTNSEQWDRMKWEYLIPVMGLPPTDTDLTITGTDLAGNQLTGFPGSFTPSSTQTVAVSQLPVRTSTSGFSNASVFPTSQTGYKLHISSSKDNPNCNTNYDSPPVAGFSYSYNNGNLTQISFVNTSYNSLYYHWDFGNGQTSTSREPGIIEYPSENFGQYYTVTLTAFNADNLQSSINKNIFIPGTEGDGGVSAIGYHTWLSGDSYSFTCWASGAYRYTITFNMGDGSSHTVTNSMGNESYNYTYTKASTSSYYTPTIHVEGYDDTGYFIGETFTPLFPILVDREDIGELSINIDIVNSSGQRITPIVDSPFYLKANCTNYQEGLTWQWVIYNTISPGDISMQCNTNNGCKVFWGQNTNAFTTPEIKLSKAGKYLSQLTVWGGGYSKVVDYVVEVQTGSECVRTLIYYEGTGNYNSNIITISKGSEMCFKSLSYIDGFLPSGTPKPSCTYYHNGYYYNTWKGVAQLDWYVNGNNSLTLQRCQNWSDYYEGLLNESICSNYYSPNLINHGAYGYFNYNFENAGLFELKLKATGGYGQGNAYIIQNDAAFNYSNRIIKVIDCDKLITLKTNMDVLRNMSNRIISKGVVNIQPTDNITLDSSWGDKIVFSANTSITIKPGFSAVAGSDLLFKIDPCPPLTSGCTSGKEIYFDLLKDDLNISDVFLSIYPNPSSGSFVIELTNDNEFISSIEVFNIVGQQVDSREKVNSFYCELNLVDEPDGAYIVRVQTQRGKQFTAKVIKAR